MVSLQTKWVTSACSIPDDSVCNIYRLDELVNIWCGGSNELLTRIIDGKTHCSQEASSRLCH